MSGDAQTSGEAPALSGHLALALLLAALILGGGGSPAPLPEMILELFALGAFTLWLVVPQSRDAWRRVPRTVWIIAALALAVPLVQLVPLPPLLWHTLPGREIELDALALIGRAESWRSWSMVPDRTAASALSLLPPLVMLIVGSTLAARQHRRLLVALALFGLLTLGVGALQITAAPASPLQFYGVTTPDLRGFQANHNATADLLLAALLASLALLKGAAKGGPVPDRPAFVLAVAAMAAALFGFGVVFTASRMGILLLPVVLLGGLWLLRRWLPRPTRRSIAGISLAILAIAAAGSLAVRQSQPLGAIVQRFAVADDLRLALWRDGLHAARRYYPVGVGMGGFVPALVIDERLEVVRPSQPNRAHNEYVELAVEAGLFGLLAWGAIVFIAAGGARRSLRSPDRRARTTAFFATAVLAVLALHSMVDYPFRSMSLAVLGALCLGQLLGPANRAGEGSLGKDRM